jgi:hypothetical protein
MIESFGQFARLAGLLQVPPAAAGAGDGPGAVPGSALVMGGAAHVVRCTARPVVASCGNIIDLSARRARQLGLAGLSGWSLPR